LIFVFFLSSFFYNFEITQIYSFLASLFGIASMIYAPARYHKPGNKSYQCKKVEYFEIIVLVSGPCKSGC